MDMQPCLFSSSNLEFGQKAADLIFLCSLFSCVSALENVIFTLFSSFYIHELKVTTTDMKYFARSKFSRSLVQKKDFGWT